jgi:hypothetical protein
MEGYRANQRQQAIAHTQHLRYSGLEGFTSGPLLIVKGTFSMKYFSQSYLTMLVVISLHASETPARHSTENPGCQEIMNNLMKMRSVEDKYAYLNKLTNKIDNAQLGRDIPQETSHMLAEARRCIEFLTPNPDYPSELASLQHILNRIDPEKTAQDQCHKVHPACVNKDGNLDANKISTFLGNAKSLKKTRHCCITPPCLCPAPEQISPVLSKKLDIIIGCLQTFKSEQELARNEAKSQQALNDEELQKILKR